MVRRSEEVAVFWDYETCPIPSTLLGMTIDNRIRVFVNSLFRWPQRLEPFEAYVDLRNGGKNLSSRRHVSPFGRNDSESTFNVLLFDCPNNRREQSVDESIIRAMLAYATDSTLPSTALATIVLITGDDHHKSNFTSPVATLGFLDHTVILVTANPEPTELKQAASSVHNWYTDIVFRSPNHNPRRQRAQQEARSFYERFPSSFPSLPPRSRSPESYIQSAYAHPLEDSSNDDATDDSPFKLLVRCLHFYKAVGCPRPRLDTVVQSIAQSRLVDMYRDFPTVEEYIWGAVDSRIVDVGGQGHDDLWVCLRPGVDVT